MLPSFVSSSRICNALAETASRYLAHRKIPAQPRDPLST